MAILNRWIWLITALTMCCGVARTSYAADPDSAAKALMTISDFAGNICNNIPLTGKSENLELNGKAQAKLAGVVKRVADLGMEGAAKYSSKEFSNVLQSDLATALKDSSQCKERVFMVLQDKLLGGVTVGGNIVTGNHNAVSSNQSGGITANTVTIAPPPRHLDPEGQRSLLNIPAGSKCTVTATASDAESYQFAAEITDFLKARGYEIAGPNSGFFMPPLVGAVIQPPDASNGRPCEIRIGSQR